MKRLITGCGSAGTKYISRVLKRLGYSMPHERMGHGGSVSFYAVGLQEDIRADFDVILHQVREPIASISSIHTMRFWEMDEVSLSGVNILKTMPQLRDENYTLQCAKYWYWWNLAAEKMSSQTYRIEELTSGNNPEMFKCWRDTLQLSAVGYADFLDAMQSTKKTNTRVKRSEYREISWGSLAALDPHLTDKIRSLASRYGYGV